VAGFLFNSVEEKMLIEEIHGVEKPNVVVGVGITELKPRGGKFREKYGDYMIYIGRIDRNKGAHILFEYFKIYRRRNPGLKLLLIGTPVIDIPEGKGIYHLGFVSEEDKWEALADALFLVIPSPLESLSMVTLEAWAASKPVLAYGKCEVLKGQVERSRGGLYFTNYYEFEEAVNLLRSDSQLRARMGENGRKYFELNYSWEVIEKKYLELAERVLK
jgi:glycosyltransferase involved in cell wall biosynthesis